MPLYALTLTAHTMRKNAGQIAEKLRVQSYSHFVYYMLLLKFLMFYITVSSVYTIDTTEHHSYIYSCFTMFPVTPIYTSSF